MQERVSQIAETLHPLRDLDAETAQTIGHRLHHRLVLIAGAKLSAQLVVQRAEREHRGLWRADGRVELLDHLLRFLGGEPELVAEVCEPGSEALDRRVPLLAEHLLDVSSGDSCGCGDVSEVATRLLVELVRADTKEQLEESLGTTNDRPAAQDLRGELLGDTGVRNQRLHVGVELIFVEEDVRVNLDRDVGRDRFRDARVDPGNRADHRLAESKAQLRRCFVQGRDDFIACQRIAERLLDPTRHQLFRGWTAEHAGHHLK